MPHDSKQPSPGFLQKIFGGSAPVNPPLPPAPHEQTVNLPPFMQRAVTDIKRQGLMPASNPRFYVPEMGSQEHIDMTRGTPTMTPRAGDLKNNQVRINPIMAHGYGVSEDQLNRLLLHETSHMGQNANSNPLYNLRVAFENKFLPHKDRYEENRAGLEAESLLARMHAKRMAQRQRGF